MRERGIADNRNHGLMLATLQAQLKAVAHGNRRAHVNAGVHRGKRGERAERIASNVARDDGLHARKLAEHKAMRAAGAQRRRAARQIVAHLGMLGSLGAEGDRNGTRSKLAIGTQRAFGLGKLHAQGAHAFAQIIAALFNNVHVFNGSGEFTNLLRRKRPRHAKLQNVSLGQCLAHVLVGCTAANNADFALVALNAVEFARFSIFGHGDHTRIERHAARLGVCRHHDPLRGIFRIGLRLNLYALSQLNGAFRMGHAHCGTNHAQHIEALGHFESVLGERKRLRRIGGIEHGNMRGAGIKA